MATRRHRGLGMMTAPQDPVKRKEAQIKFARETVKKWEAKLRSHGVSVEALAVNTPYKGGVANKYRITTTHTTPHDPGYGPFMAMLERETNCRVVPYKSERCEFDVYQRVETMTFSFWLFVVDIALVLMWLCVFFVLLGATAYLFPYLPFASVVRGRVQQVLSWCPYVNGALV